MSIIEQIFRLTTHGFKSTLNKWSIRNLKIDVPIEVSRLLIFENILVLDSGNLETGEEHYVYNPDLIGKEITIKNEEISNSLISILRQIKLNSIDV
jgi:hypothetical protein